MRKPSKSYLKKKADTLFSKRIREKGYCELQGLDKIKCCPILQCMHIDTRGKLAIRYEDLNAICGCKGHHVYYTHHERDWMSLVEKNFPEKHKFVEEHKNDLWFEEPQKEEKLLFSKYKDYHIRLEWFDFPDDIAQLVSKDIESGKLIAIEDYL